MKYILFVFVSMAFYLLTDFSPIPKKNSGMCNGGKAHGPFELISSLAENMTVTAHQEVEINLALKFYGSCDSVQTRVRGLNGVEVLGSHEFTHASCAQENVLSNLVHIRVPENTRGWLAIDVVYISHGQQKVETRAIEVHDEQGLNSFLRQLKQEGLTNAKVRVSKAEEVFIKRDPHSRTE